MLLHNGNVSGYLNAAAKGISNVEGKHLIKSGGAICPVTRYICKMINPGAKGSSPETATYILPAMQTIRTELEIKQQPKMNRQDSCSSKVSPQPKSKLNEDRSNR